MKLINIEVDDIHMWDYPDFCDAFISYAEHPDGKPLTDEELEKVNEDADFVYEQVQEHLY